MLVILLKDIPGIGLAGQTVDVSQETARDWAEKNQSEAFDPTKHKLDASGNLEQPKTRLPKPETAKN